MPDLSKMSDDDLMAAYGQAQKSSDATKMSDHDLLNAYDVARAHPAGQLTDYGTPIPGSSPEFDSYIANSGIGHVLDAVGHGAKQGWGTQEIVSPDTADLLRKAGVFPDAAKPQHDIIRGFNEAMLRPAAAGLDMAIRAGGQFLRGTGAAISGLQAGIAQTGEELGAPQLGRDVAGMIEAFPQEGMGLQGVLPQTHVPFSLDVARAEGVLGTEAEWKGIDHPTEDFPAGTTTHFPAPVEHTLGEAPQPYEATLSPDVQQMVSEATPPKDIHEAARRVAPSVFDEFDSLKEGQDALRSQIAMGQESLRQAAEAQAPHAAEIADLEERLQDTTPRLAKKYEARLAALVPERDAFLADEFTMSVLTRDTPEIASMRQQLQELDYRMRDLAPDVTAAYREAEKQFPEEVTPPVAAPVNPASEAAAQVTPPEAKPVVSSREPQLDTTAAPTPVPVAAATGTAPLNIAADVSKKLVAAGRPLEEADAAGAVQEALWRTRADTFQGAKGSAEEMYASEAPDIRAGKTRARVPEMAQTKQGKIRLTDDGRAVITLFKDANASTFLHETGHDWLERMVRDAADPAAPEQMRTDAATVRSYLGNDGGDLTTRQHEKFARSFERYFMEGHAPSRGLASVFEKFRNWLTTIYQTVDRLRAPITDDIRDVFDRLLTRTPERAVIAKEAEQQAFADRMTAGLDREVDPTKIFAGVAEDLADLHETDAQTTPPEQASSTADQMEREIDAIAKTYAPEVADALTRANEPPAAAEPGATGVGGNTTARAGAAGSHANSGEPEHAGGAAKLGTGTEGSGGAATEGVAGAESGAAASPYTRVPKEPERLINFLRRATADGKPGGLRDSTGDISAIVGGTKGRPGLINNRTGQSLDDATLRAWQAGYFPGLDQRPSINDLLDAIRDDHAGNPRYSMHDQDAADAYDQANAQNSEIDHLADRHGIDPTGLTREQFFDKIAEKLSLDELEHEIRNAADTGFADMDAAIRDVGEPPGYDTARSAEDLENEARQEDASRPAQQGAGRGPGPGHAGTSPDNGKGGGEQVGGGAGAAGGTGAEVPKGLPPLDVKAEPADFRTKADREIEKAANIRLDKINTTADMNDALRDLAKQNGDFMDARYGTPAFQTHLDIRNTRTLLRAATSDVMEAAVKAAGGDVEAIADFARKQQRAAMVFSHLSTLSADWAHAGHELNRVMPEWDKALNVAQQIQDTTGRTLFQLQQQAAAMLNMPTAEQAGKMAGDAQMTRWQKIRGGIISYFINNLISGPLTHMAYGLGNVTTALYRAVPETLVQASIGAMRGAPDRVYFGEAGAQLFGLAHGAGSGIGPAMKALKTGIANLPGQPEALGFRPQSIPGKGGYILETPSRGVTAIHTLFYSMSYSAEIARLAFRDAAARGLRDSAFDAEVARLTSSPTPEMMDGADSVATRGVLMKRPEFGSPQDYLTKFANSNIAAKLIMPFMQIGMNILEEGIVQRTPLSLLTSEARAELTGARGGAARDLRIGKIATGSMLGGAAVGLAASGYMTGSGPVNADQRRVLEDTGWKAYSIKFGDTYVPYRKYLGFLGPLVASAADVYEVGHALHGEDLTKATGALAFGFSEVVADETWMTGLSSFIEAARNWDTKGEQYLRNLATSFIPFSVGLSQTARMVDPYQRQARTLIDAARNKIPVVSEGLQPQIGIWGQPIASHTMLSPGTDTHDPVDARLRALGFGVTPVERKVTGIPLTDPQYANLQRTAGMLAHTRLSAMMQAPGFAQLPAGIQTKAIQETITRSREAARALTKMQNPAIPQQAAQNKQNLRMNGKPGAAGY